MKKKYIYKDRFNKTAGNFALKINPAFMSGFIKRSLILCGLFIFFQANAQKFWLTTYEFPGGPKTSIALAGDSTLYASTPAGIIRSFNQGFKFDTVLKATNINSLLTVGSSSVFAGGWGKIYSSNDSGTSWDTIPLNANYPVQQIIRKQNGNLFAITGLIDTSGLMGAGVYFSDNNRKSWTQRNSGLGGFLCANAITCDKNGRLYLAVADELATGAAGLFYSDNDGQQWHHVDIVIDGQMVIADSIQVVKTTCLTVTPQDSLYISFEGVAVNTLVKLTLSKSINDIPSDSKWDKIKMGNSSNWWLDRPIGPVHFAQNGDRYSSFEGSMKVGGTLFSKNGYGWSRHDEGLGLDITGARNFQQFVETSAGIIFMIQYADERIYVTDTSSTIPNDVDNIDKPGAFAGIYPIPATTCLNLQNPDNIIYGYSIRNLLGQTIQRGEVQQQIDVSHLQTGAYLIQLKSTNDEEITSIFIKQ